METNRIPSLDGLRALSILLVLLAHVCGTPGFFGHGAIAWTGPVGPLGVHVFFVISGYLITGLLLKEHRRTGTISLRMFYFRRAFRILPASFLYIGVILGGVWLGRVVLHPGEAFHLLTYTINYQPETAWRVAHMWSLSVEEHFYLVWPLIFWLLGIRKGAWFAASILAIAPVCRYLLIAQTGISGQPLQTQAVADSLAAGCLLAILRPWLHRQEWYRRILNFRAAAFLPLLALLLNFYPYGRIRWVVVQSVLDLNIVLMIDYCITRPESPLGRFLNYRPVAFIGVISYSLYLWQQAFLDRVEPSWITTFPQNLVLSFVAAAASYYLVESPFLHLRKRLEDRWAAGRTRATAPEPAAASSGVSC